MTNQNEKDYTGIYHCASNYMMKQFNAEKRNYILMISEKQENTTSIDIQN